MSSATAPHSPAAREGSAEPVSKRKRTARPKVSCGFCRRRKLKCNLETPCSNCVAQGHDCEALERSTKPRPTHQRIEELELQVEQLEGFLGRLAIGSPEQRSADLTEWEKTGQLPLDITVPGSVEPLPSGTPETREAFDTISRLHIDSSSGHATSHGPTSAFFDDSMASTGGIPVNSSVVTLTDVQIRSRLMTFNAEQRHGEMIALALGSLDFDGVPPELAMHLLALHWNRQHHAFLITYRPLFMRDMASAGPYFSKLLLNAIYFSVAKFSKRPEVYDNVNDPRTAGLRFFRRVKELMGEALDKSRIPTIQALLLLSSSLFALGWQSAPWVYSGVAFRMLLDLGLHHDWRSRVVDGGDVGPPDLEIRRRLVWAAFVFDKIISLYQGRSVTLQEIDMKVPPVFFDMYEEQEPWTPFAFTSIGTYTGSASYSVSTFKELCSLSVLMGRIINTFYAEHRSPDPLRQLEALNASLAEWSEQLPTYLRYNASDGAAPVPPPHVLSLYSIFYTLTVLVNRPFLESGHLQSLQAPIAGQCWARCETAAMKATAILTRYREAFALSRAPYLIAYGTYIAATIMVRTAAQQGSTSDAARCLKICVEGLKENADVNTGAQKTLAIIQGLVQRLGVAIASSPDVPEGRSECVTLPSASAESIDINAIMSSFDFGQSSWNPGALDNLVDSSTFQQDSLYGISLLRWPGDGGNGYDTDDTHWPNYQ